MRSLYLLALLMLSGCGFAKWAMTDDPKVPGPAPAAVAARETIEKGLTALEQGGIYAGLAALLLTAGKSAARLYRDYSAWKKTP